MTKENNHQPFAQDDRIMKRLFKEINAAFNAIDCYFKDINANPPVREKLKNAYHKTLAISKMLEEEERPHWYKLYEGLCGSHIELKERFKMLKSENAVLKAALLNSEQGAQECDANTPNQGTKS